METENLCVMPSGEHDNCMDFISQTLYHYLTYSLLNNFSFDRFKLLYPCWFYA